jgi:hypothetical protein
MSAAPLTSANLPTIITEMMEFLENLDVPGLTCPPKSASPAKMAVYRLVDHTPMEPDDIWSYRKIYPNKVFRVDECKARACSVFTDREDVIKLKKIRNFKNKKLVLINIEEKDGVLLNTPGPIGKSHHSWWISKIFSITANNVKEAV